MRLAQRASRTAPCGRGGSSPAIVRYATMLGRQRGFALRIETLYEFLLLTSNLNFTETAKSF